MGGCGGVGVRGVAVVGENLVLNLEGKGYTVAVYNRSTDKVDKFISGRAKGKSIIGTHSIKELVEKLEKPRKVILLVRAGEAVDSSIGQLLEVMEEGDVIIDSGNSNYRDTQRRAEYVESKGLYYVGNGISGGEEGALCGASMMPGGSEKAWPLVKPLLQSAAAKVSGGIPCCDWIGPDGAGHFVKMIHNGIEYGDMQLICESYQLLKDVVGLGADELQKVFSEWNKTELNSYLIDSTSSIFSIRDGDSTTLLGQILDVAGQKGTGKWASIASMEEGVPLTLISESVYARFLSSIKEERECAYSIYKKEKISFSGDENEMIEDIRKALLASKIVSYAQGFALMCKASRENNWNLNLGSIALLWRGGCIIRSSFLEKIRDAYERNNNLANLIIDPYFADLLKELIPSWRKVVAFAVQSGVPCPAFASALSYFDGYTSIELPANLLQAQRDYFGAHTYERIDCERGRFFHTNWTGEGGETSSTTYNV